MGERSRWEEIEAVCQAALDRRPDERPVFVAAACGDDKGLRREVEALLAHADGDAAFMESPLAAVAAHALGADEDALTGSRIGSLEIGRVIGRGGMGEVYLARDTRLERDVAIKSLPTVFAQDPDRLARFKREALILASLNHPNIAAIYGLEDLGDAQALVLELVEGPTLDERLRESALSIEDTISIARQMAEALEAAHERGIVHRDLKPANVKLRPDGIVKVLDFGLATAFDPVVEQGLRPTEKSSHAMAAGVLGTPKYMSPEQRAGQSTDKRSDIWAFGTVLYEMLAGRPLFGAQPVADRAAVPEDVDWSRLHRDTPAALRRLIARCLERNPRQRLRDIGEARIVLEPGNLELSPELVVPLEKRAFWRRAVPLTVVALAAAGLTAAVTVRLRPSPRAVVARFTVTLPDSQALARADGRHAIAIASDGIQIVYAGIPAALYRRDLSQSEPIAIKGSESLGRVSEPTFSPDGRSIAFYANGAIRTIPVTGGSASTLVSAEPPYGMSWGRDGIVFGQARRA